MSSFKKKLEEEKYIDERMQSLIKMGVEINTKNFEEVTGIKMWKFTEYFGGIRKYYKSRGYKYNNKTCIDKEKLVEDVLTVYNRHQHITQEIYLSNGKYSRAAIQRIFGSFNKMLEALGLSTNINHDLETIDKKDILEEMWALYRMHGKLTARIQRTESKYSQNVIDYHFGGFNNMLCEMGLEYNLMRYTDDEILYDIKLLYYKYGLISSELIDEYSIVTTTTCYQKFGTIRNICNILHVEYNERNESSGSKVIKTLLEEDYGVKYEIEKTWEWLINPQTLRPMRVDFYIPEKRLCIEYNGQQHYEYIPHFHSSVDDFEKAVQRDKQKEQLARKHDLNFATIKYDENIKTKLAYIMDQFK